MQMEIINVTFAKFANRATFNQLNQLNKRDEKVGYLNLLAKLPFCVCVRVCCHLPVTSCYFHYFTNRTWPDNKDSSITV